MTFDEVRKLALVWPGVEDGTSYGTPALKVKGKFLTRLREDGDSLVVKGVGFDEREMLMEARPDVFYITDHHRDWPMVLVRLSKADRGTIEALLLRAWRDTAPKRLVAEFDGESPKPMPKRQRKKRA
ncbi:MAG: MmcQ/YjbR family DNA-binding protein [Variibacter sp.]